MRSLQFILFRILAPRLFRGFQLTTLILAFCGVGRVAGSAPLQITEFLADNNHSIRDEDGDASDWIEIHNQGTTVEFLDGWYLTDDPIDLMKWRFPEGVEMQPDAYRVIFASGKDRTNALGRLHTNFKLSSNGEYLALVDPEGRIVSQFSPAIQFEDVSYGRDVGDPSLSIYFPKPSPGVRNVTGGPGFASEVMFSREEGTFPVSEPFLLTLSAFPSNAVIYYSFGTNVPGANTNVGRYTGPLLITNSVIIRARSFVDGLLPGPITSKSYLALAEDVLNFSSDLPLMIVHNFGQGQASVTNQHVSVQTFEPGAGRSSLLSGPAQVERGRFHIRGITSSLQPKSPFFLEIQDEFGADKESELLGLPQESDWALYAPYRYDPPMMHNTLAYQMMRDFGRYAPRTRYVELFLKDDGGASGPITAADYNGVYVLTEKIKRDDNRVAIDKLEPEQLSEPEITGGYLFSIDQDRDGTAPQLNAGGVFMHWISPRSWEMTNVLRRPQIAYVSNYFTAFTNALSAPQSTNGGYAGYIDTDSWIDYHLHQVLTMNVDALAFSTYLYKPRGERIVIGPPWDFDRSQGTVESESFNPRVWNWRSNFDFGPWWSRLFADQDFWQRWIDRFQDLRAGPLSTNSIFAHIDRFADQLWDAQIRDQARWGASVRQGTATGLGYTYDFGTKGSLTNEVAFLKAWYSDRLNFLDTNFLSRPELSRPGGWVESGSLVTISPALKPGSAMLYTLDGTDPRFKDGAVSPAALSSVGPVTIVINSNICLAARSFNTAHSNMVGGTGPILSSPWSGLLSAGFYISRPPLRITEVMYHPRSLNGTNSDDLFEYIEVMNVGSQPLDLARFKLRGGVEFDFPNLQLPPGAIGVVAANENGFASRYGSNLVLLGAFRGNLDNSGERLALIGPCNEPILDFRYDDDWYRITDGSGFSLEVLDPNAPIESWGLKSQWQVSGRNDGSAGQYDPIRVDFPNVVVNELLSHTDTPPPYDAVELRNQSSSIVDVGGWFLSDDFGAPKKYRIPENTFIAPGGFLVLDERQFNSGGVNGIPFSFSSLGDEVYLFSGDANGDLTGYFHGFIFGPQENGITLGRELTSDGHEHFVRQQRNTLGEANAGAGTGPIVISEIMYHPPDFWRGVTLSDNSVDEFIELRNVSTASVLLYDPTSPLNTWRISDAVEFSFPPNTIIPAGGFALVVGFSPNDTATLNRFRSRYRVPSEVPVFGPYVGKLDNSSEAVELRKPDTPRPFGPPEFGVVPYPLVECVRYSDHAPWPDFADGYGVSLHRVDSAAFENEPTNWVAAAPSPGRPYTRGRGPTILSPPQDTTAVEYTTTRLKVRVSGTGFLTFQWLFMGQAIPGATNAELAITNIQVAQAGRYEVIVGDAVSSIKSESAQLTVLDSVEIVTHPLSRIVAPGSNVMFSVTASSTTPLSYQWRFNGTNLLGQQGQNLTLVNVTNDHDGSYSVLVSDAISSRLSNPATLSVLIRGQMVEPTPPLRITATSNQVVTLGARTIGATPMFSRWRRISPSGSASILTNYLATGHTHFVTFPIAGLTNGTYVYTLILSNQVHTNLNFAYTNAFVNVVADSDQDGIPDAYEVSHQFRADDPGDAGMDADGDGFTNVEEFVAGTEPRDPESYPMIDSIFIEQWPFVRFEAVSNRTYTVQYRDVLESSDWRKLADILPRSLNRVETVPDPLGGTNRFYRLATPRQP